MTLDGKSSDEKTLFPDHWDWLECLINIIEALNDIRYQSLIEEKRLLIIDGLSSSGILIRLVINKITGKVITFFILDAEKILKFKELVL